MKTHAFKNNETVKAATHFTFSVLIIIGVTLMVFKNQSQSALSDEREKTNRAMRVSVFSPTNVANEELATETSQFMAELNSYLVPENEIELQIEDAISITFPDSKEPVFPMENHVAETDNVLNDLKILAASICNETIDMIELEMKARTYLVNETEAPLSLESWMTDEKCWCRENR